MARTTPSLRGGRKLLKKGEEEQEFWEAHYQEFVEKYPEQFVAVYDGQVVETCDHLQRLVQLLQDRGIAATHVWVQFITADPHRFLL